jgi:hypothetical protein
MSDAWWHWFWTCLIAWIIYVGLIAKPWKHRASPSETVKIWLLATISLICFGRIFFLSATHEPYRPSVLTGCKSNLKNIGTASEMYSTDNKGDYAPSLARLTPNYLRLIPTCPSVERNTYSRGYTAINSHVGQTPYNAYTVVCTGNNHVEHGLPRNYPQYTSVQGLISM